MEGVRSVTSRNDILEIGNMKSVPNQAVPDIGDKPETRGTTATGVQAVHQGCPMMQSVTGFGLK